MIVNRLARRQMSAAMLINMPTRKFSLLVPMDQRASAPEEVENTPIHDAALANQQAFYKEYNESCYTQLEEMN